MSALAFSNSEFMIQILIRTTSLLYYNKVVLYFSLLQVVL